MGYVYRGTIRDVDEPITEPFATPARAPFDPVKCGTYAGYKQHQNHKNTPCRACKDAASAYQRDLKRRREAGLVVREFRDDKCGTLAGYSRHFRLGVPVCDPCLVARAEYRAAYYAMNAA